MKKAMQKSALYGFILEIAISIRLYYNLLTSLRLRRPHTAFGRLGNVHWSIRWLENIRIIHHRGKNQLQKTNHIELFVAVLLLFISLVFLKTAKNLHFPWSFKNPCLSKNRGF